MSEWVGERNGRKDQKEDSNTPGRTTAENKKTAWARFLLWIKAQVQIERLADRGAANVGKVGRDLMC